MLIFFHSSFSNVIYPLKEHVANNLLSLNEWFWKKRTFAFRRYIIFVYRFRCFLAIFKELLESSSVEVSILFRCIKRQSFGGSFF